ncbi:MAG: hypothetical protein AB1668_05820 [Nanoarchaeota archaeon]
MAGDSETSTGNPGFWLLIAGLTIFFIVEFFHNDYVSIGFGIAFLLFSAFSIFKGKGAILTIVFLLWYILLGGPIDFTVILVNMAWMVVLAVVIHGIVKLVSGKKEESAGEKFAEGAKGELFGLIPIAVFLLDLGIVQYYLREFGFSADMMTLTLLTFTPWWAYLGLFYAKTGSGENSFINFIVTAAKVLMILWIVPLLIFGIMPDAYATYKSSLPGPEELLKAKEEVRAQLPKTENIAFSNAICSFTEPTNLKACVERRQKDSQFKYKCKEDERVKQGALSLAECIKEQEKAQAEGRKIVEGAVSDVVKQVTSAEIKIDETYFPKSTANKKAVYPATLELKNPRRQEIAVAVNCIFKKKGAMGGESNVSGNVSGNILVKGEEKSQFTVSKTEESIPIKCIPSTELQGAYDFLLTAELSGLTTPSYLTRAFLGVMDDELMKKKIEEIKADKFPNTKAIVSQAPQEFARINYAFGVTEKDPVIPVNEIVSFSSSIENTGRGEIVRINNYIFDLQEAGFKVKSGDANCLQGGEVSVVKGKSSVLTGCFLELPAGMKAVKDYNVQTFAGYLSYDYIIKKEMLNIKAGETSS